MNEDGHEWISRLSLEPHPEGGWFRRIHTDARVVDTPNGPRAALTSIHYLLTRAQPLGRLHRNRSDILHYLQDGGPVEYVLLDPEGRLRRVVLGRDPDQALFLCVSGGVWKASRLIGTANHALVSEVVTPGFDYADHEFGGSEILDRYPDFAAEIAPLLRGA
jgi:predicted cupin superfamily sugar epimerase